MNAPVNFLVSGQHVEVVRVLHSLREDGIVGFAVSVILREAHASLKNPGL